MGGQAADTSASQPNVSAQLGLTGAQSGSGGRLRPHHQVERPWEDEPRTPARRPRQPPVREPPVQVREAREGRAGGTFCLSPPPSPVYAAPTVCGQPSAMNRAGAALPALLQFPFQGGGPGGLGADRRESGSPEKGRGGHQGWRAAWQPGAGGAGAGPEARPPCGSQGKATWKERPGP